MKVKYFFLINNRKDEKFCLDLIFNLAELEKFRFSLAFLTKEEKNGSIC